mmetsp:Transcript_35720/g.85971  ORF Transcript_35720/g.85971 Transcript_35720/m.85971 type:complete len:210 (+) Transcript_35720:387-1016(+)
MCITIPLAALEPGKFSTNATGPGGPALPNQAQACCRISLGYSSSSACPACKTTIGALGKFFFNGSKQSAKGTTPSLSPHMNKTGTFLDARSEYTLALLASRTSRTALNHACTYFSGSLLNLAALRSLSTFHLAGSIASGSKSSRVTGRRLPTLPAHRATGKQRVTRRHRIATRSVGSSDISPAGASNKRRSTLSGNFRASSILTNPPIE